MAARDIALMNAVYPDVPAVVLPVDGGGAARFTEVSDTTATASDVATGKYFYTASGVKTVGTASGGGSGGIINVADYGAVGDGVTDDSQAIQDACDAGYDIYFESNKTYYIPSVITIDHDIHLHGGENTVIKTETVSNAMNNVFVVSGTLKKTTTLTTDYASDGSTDNSGNQFTLSDMTGIDIDDIMVITATDQYYNYSRQYYYLGGTLLIGDIYNGHLYTTTNLPFDIENTENVTVQIYSAPVAIIENLNFVADMDSGGGYKWFIQLNKCRNSIVRNCRMTEMDNGIQMYNCFNSLIECVEVSKAKELNSRSGDSYAIAVYSSTNTTIERVNAICAQSCICLSGNVTVMNTYIKHCSLCSECRPNAIGSHENSYNTVIEDCTVTGINVLGTAIINRCRFIKNNRVNSGSAITFCGSHNPKYAMLKIGNCVFEAYLNIYLYASEVQNPIQAFDNIIGLVEVTDCDGGYITFDGTTSEYILSNCINELRLERWRNCKEVYRPRTQDIIKNLIVADCTFTRTFWINNHLDASGIVLDGVENLDYRNSIPLEHTVAIEKETYGTNVLLPENTPILLSSNSETAKFIVTGKNIVSDNADDYFVGSVGGSEGYALTRTQSTGSSVPSVTVNANGDLVYTQKSNTSSYSFYPAGMVYVEDVSDITISATVKNTGATSGASFRPMIAIVDCKTGLVLYRGWGTAVEATAQGASATHTYLVPANCVAMGYFYCNSAVNSSETTFEDLTVTVVSKFAPASIPSDEPYIAVRRTGDGTVYSLPGLNHIMSSETTFNVKLKADYIKSAGTVLLDGSGVSF